MQILVCASYAALLASGAVNAQPAMPETHVESAPDELTAEEAQSPKPIDQPMAPSETVPAETPVPEIPTIEAVQTATLPEGTQVVVMMNDEISTLESAVGDRFGVTVLQDVVDRDTIVIPQGATGYGEVTFRSGKGGFGKPGILGIALRKVEVGENNYALDGRYREEGGNKNTAVAATWFAVGIFSGFIKGKAGVIPKGRELRARTGEDIDFVIGAAPPPVPVPENPEQPELADEIEISPSLLPTDENQPSINEQVPAQPESE
jgi:hypothetical protein